MPNYYFCMLHQSLASFKAYFFKSQVCLIINSHLFPIKCTDWMITGCNVFMPSPISGGMCTFLMQSDVFTLVEQNDQHAALCKGPWTQHQLHCLPEMFMLNYFVLLFVFLTVNVAVTTHSFLQKQRVKINLLAVFGFFILFFFLWAYQLKMQTCSTDVKYYLNLKVSVFAKSCCVCHSCIKSVRFM